jgi:methyl-accepting chemotaxis protein
VAGEAVNSMKRASISAQIGIQLIDEISASLDSLLKGIEELDTINLTIASVSEE